MKNFLFISLIFLYLPAFCLKADTFKIDTLAKDPANTKEGILRPTNGMTKPQVKAQFGMPQIEYQAIGNPPISRWAYPKYTVYFEYNKVIRSVIKSQYRLH